MLAFHFKAAALVSVVALVTIGLSELSAAAAASRPAKKNSAEGTGILPKGNGREGPAQSPPNMDEKPDVKTRSCYADILNPPGSPFAFSKDGNTLYFLANTTKGRLGAKDKSGGGGANATARQTLYKINFEDNQAEAILSLGMKNDPVLVTYGDPVQGMTAVAFFGAGAGAQKGLPSDCYAGAAGLITVSLVKDGSKPVRAKGAFEMTRTPSGFLLVDMKKEQILDIEPSNFQRRLKRKIPAGERPLYFDEKKGELITFFRSDMTMLSPTQENAVAPEGTTPPTQPVNSPAPVTSPALPKAGLPAKPVLKGMPSGGPDRDVRLVQSYKTKRDKADKQLKLKPGDRILQDGVKIAVVHLDSAKNELTVIEVPGWNGDAKPGSFTVEVPMAQLVALAAAEINMDKRLLLISGASIATKQSWQKILLFDYGRKKLLAKVAVGAREFVNFASINASGTKVIYEVRDSTNNRTLALKIYDISSAGTKAIALPPPPSDMKAQ